MPSQPLLLAKEPPPSLGGPAVNLRVKTVGSVAVALLALASFLTPALSRAAAKEPRITGTVDDADRIVLSGSRPSVVTAEADEGPIDPATVVEGASITFARTPAQEAELRSLIEAQRDASSPLYRRWLTPEEYGARYGAAAEDVLTVTLWLSRHGLTVYPLSRGGVRLRFSGTAGQIGAAFGTELHRYRVGGRLPFAPSTDVSVPRALAPAVEAITGLSSIRPRSHLRFAAPEVAPGFTSGQTGKHYVTPADLATIYDITPAYAAGWDGSGQSIAVVGQSAISLSDLEHFQSAAGLPVKDPILVLVPGSGNPAVHPTDEAESDVDLEYTSGIAPGATIDFVYVGDAANLSVWDALIYAVDNNVAPIISMSYGSCEPSLAPKDYSTLQTTLSQAAVQGQSVVAATGDGGSLDCLQDPSLSSAVQKTPAVDYPSSSQYVTGIGGTEFSAAEVAPGNSQYWASKNGADLVSSAVSYIPEQVWNDSGATGVLTAGGGGASSLASRPTWQANVPGIPSGTNRLVPDLSLDSSGINAPYIYCSSDVSTTGVTGSCAQGFRDANGVYLTVAGGTSFAAPIFAGMVALLNQRFEPHGQGVVAATLYGLAANPTTYASAFHDITSGNNGCSSGASSCTSPYSAGPGYDEASGLGSVDFFQLFAAWPSSGTPLLPSKTTIAASTTSPQAGTDDAVTISVGSASGASTTVPTGTVTLAVDGTSVAPPLTLSNGSAAYTFNSSTLGVHLIRATYSGDATYAASTASLSITVPGKTFTVAATNVTVHSGGSSPSTITVTPEDGYTGTIAWVVSSQPALSSGCFTLPDTAVAGTSPITTTLTVHASTAGCGAAAQSARSEGRGWPRMGPAAPTGPSSVPLPMRGTLASLALFGLLYAGRLSRANRPSLCLTLLLGASIGTGLLACSGGASTGPAAPITNATKGTYTVKVVGTDTLSASITASTTFVLVID